MRARSLVPVAALIVALVIAASAADDPLPVLLTAESPSGAVWINLTITRLRITEPYLPIVLAVQNLADAPVVIDRSAVRLIGPDGIRHPIADLKELRDGYGKKRLDRRIVSFAGIPLDVWYRQGRLRESNFFPEVGAGSGVVIDQLVLRRSDACADLMYFRRPVGLSAGDPFILEVAPEGWEAPVRMGLRLE